MAPNEKTSQEMASLAAKALKAPKKLTAAEIKSLAGSVLTQSPDKPKPKPRPKKK
ncbi:MAG: hypothetical protein SX243_21830 [Acidobacteriota bacterium]|nr:hypothetical protein [Acidobacteriota bacterium]